MIPYYGSKSKIAHKYQPPIYDKIIEPFAGSARYSLLHWNKEVLLTDTNADIITIWHYLQNCNKKDILGLPVLKQGERLSDFDLSNEEMLLLRNFASVGSSIGDKFSKFGVEAFDSSIKAIANNLYKIKHWIIKQADYNTIDNEQATWFIDPPYIKAGKYYKNSSKKIDYNHLGDWCKSRNGQIIVCESLGADWLDFKPFCTCNGISKKTVEVVYCNYQDTLF